MEFVVGLLVGWVVTNVIWGLVVRFLVRVGAIM